MSKDVYSNAMEETGSKAPYFPTQLIVICTLWSSEGGIHPLGLVRLSKRRGRYQVFLLRLPLLTARRFSRSRRICCPRCFSWDRCSTWSSPSSSFLTRAKPVFCEPGSILSSTSCTTLSSTVLSTRRIVKGCILCTLARPCSMSFLALLGEQGISGFLCLSNTNTFTAFLLEKMALRPV